MPLDEAATESPAPKAQWFTTTHWSVVLAAGKDSSSLANSALEQLCRIYWPPLYAYVRRRGYNVHDAQDLTQGFFAAMLEKNYVGLACPDKGRFRSYLLSALNHFLGDEADRANAAKRGGGQPLISLDEQAGEELLTPGLASDQTPEKEFQRNWVITLLRQGLDRLGEESRASGKARLFEALKPFLESDASSGEYVAIAARLAMTANGVAVAVHRLRQRYRELVRAEVAQTVASPEELEDELRHLFEALS